MEALYYNIIIVCVVLFVPFFFANWLTKGMLIKLMKVFSSRGGKLLVEVIHPIQNYYVIGMVREGRLIVKDKSVKRTSSAKEKQIDVSPGDVFRSFGVNCLRYDETGNRIVRPDLTVVAGFDALKQENLFIRSLFDPKVSKQEKLVLYVLVVAGLTLLIVGLTAYNQSTMADQVLNITKQVGLLTSSIPVV